MPTRLCVLTPPSAIRWLKSYRSYKFPFVGRPAAPPDVHAAVTTEDSIRTTVYVSWNGATEVSSWKLYKTTNGGKTETPDPVATVERTGFETMLELDGYATYVVLEAVDRNGTILGRSDVFETKTSSQLPDNVLEKEKQWLDRVSASGFKSWKSTVTSGNGAASILGGLVLIVMCIFAFRFWRRRGRRWIAEQRSGPSYELVDRDESAFELGHDENDERDSLDKSRAPVP